MKPHNATLRTCLEITVPLLIAEIPFWSPYRRAKATQEAADAIAHGGDATEFGCRREPGLAARGFNGLAQGLALAAYTPGGVTFARLHWCVTPHDGCPHARPVTTVTTTGGLL